MGFVVSIGVSVESLKWGSITFLVIVVVIRCVYFCVWFAVFVCFATNNQIISIPKSWSLILVITYRLFYLCEVELVSMSDWADERLPWLVCFPLKIRRTAPGRRSETSNLLVEFSGAQYQRVGGVVALFMEFLGRKLIFRCPI